MSRFSFRSAAVLALIAASPVAAHYLDSSGGGSEPVVSSVVTTQVKSPDPADNTAAPLPDGSPTSPGPRQIASAAAAARSSGEAALAGAICQFLQEYAGFRAGPAATGAAQLPCDPGTASAHPRVLVAIIPDPARTHLELRFDRAIDDIQYAAQLRGWQFDSDWIPWDNRARSDPDRFGDRLLDQAARKARNTTAGALLFRPNHQGTGTPDAPLIVLVAGDTPTGGVDPRQFHSIIQMWNALRPPAAGPANLDILGPSFSGSVQSLVHLLPAELKSLPGAAEDACGGVQVRVASGTVTGSEQLEQLLHPQPGFCAVRDVVSFAMDGKYESEMLQAFLAEKAVGRRVAQLTEEETTFGQNVATPPPSSTVPAPPASSRSNKDSEPKVPEAYLVLRFPREISRLREAYEQNSIIGFGSSGGDGPRSQLRFESGPDRHGSDTVPSFSGIQSTLAMESAMADIAVTLNQERVSTVLLSATDVFDEIFVARYLQQHVPRVTVIIQDTDLLLLRSGSDAGLLNTYVASPWPMIPQNQLWTANQNPEQRRYRASEVSLTVHQSQGDQGARAAALYLLDPPGASASPAPSEYRSPFTFQPEFNNRPPLWLSLIGHGLFAPVALVDSDLLAQDGAARHRKKLQLPKPPPTNLVPIPSSSPPNGVFMELPLQSKLLVTAIAILLVWHGFACWLSRLDRRFAWSYALADAEHHVRRLSLQIAISMATIPAVALLHVPTLPGFTIQHQYFDLCTRLIKLAAIALAAYSAYRLSELVSTAHRRRVIFFAMVVFSLALFAWIAAPLIWWVIEPTGPTERLFFLERSAMLMPGTSPAFPLILLFATLVFWLYSHFARLAFFGHRIPRLPEGFTKSHCPDPEMVRPVTDLFSGYAGANLLIFLLSILLVFVVLRMSGSWGPTSLGEGGFDNCVRWATALIGVLILHDIAVAALGWQLLRQRCLMELKRSPLRWGFSWIKGFSWKRIWTGARVLSPDILFDYLSRMRETNSRAAFHDQSMDDAFAAVIETSCRPISNPLWSSRVALKFIELHKIVSCAAAWKLGELEQIWKYDSGPLTGTDTLRGFHLEQPVHDLKDGERERALGRMAREEFVALLYLGYIRMVLIQIRNRVMTALMCYVLLLWALTSYTWTNHHAIILAMSALLAALSGVVLYIYGGMHRDEILSRTTETEPGKLDSEFFEKTIPTLGIPLLSLIASQFPEFSNLIFSWIEPGLRGH